MLIDRYDPHLKAGASFYATLPVPRDLIDDSLSSFHRPGEPMSPSRRKHYEHGGKLSLDGTRRFGAESEGQHRSVTWIIEIVSQVIFTTTATVGYEVLLGRDEKSLSFGFPFGPGNNRPGSSGSSEDENGVMSGSLQVKLQGTKELWNLPPFPSWNDEDPRESELDPEKQDEAREARRRRRRQRKPKKVHLVVITHGMHSNTGADMLFMKEAIDEEERKTDALFRERREAEIAAGREPPDEDEREQVIVRGYHENATMTEKGIKFLGKRLAKWVLHTVDSDNPPPERAPHRLTKPPPPRKKLHHPHLTDAAYSTTDSHAHHEVLPYKITSISFIGHSLGGLTQTYAIAYIHSQHPNFFHDIKPVNFVALATPFLGLSNENPIYVKFALDFGLVGRTGQDLGLSWRAPTNLLPSVSRSKASDTSSKPLLRILPTGPAHEVFKMFRNRTVYANVVNDGIVPLRTSCLLFLDWKALGRVEKARRANTFVGGLAEWGFGQLVTGNGANHRRSPTERSIVEEDMIPEETENENPVSKAPRSADATSRELDRGELNPTSEPKPNAFSSLMTMFRPHAGGQSNSRSSSSSSIRPKRPIAPAPAPKIYRRSQTVSPPSSPSPTYSPSDDDLLAPPKTTIFEAAGDVLNPPLPTSEFIMSPASRPRTIFHDRVYHSRDIPAPPQRLKRSSVSNLLSPTATSTTAELRVEEKIARAYHRGLSWRKVLVRLEPDAHNNMIVRRMFANAYGWPVVQHLVETHFGLSEAATTPDSDEDSRENSENVGTGLPDPLAHKLPPAHPPATISEPSSAAATDDPDAVDLTTVTAPSPDHPTRPGPTPRSLRSPRSRASTLDSEERWSESALRVTDDEADSDPTDLSSSAPPTPWPQLFSRSLLTPASPTTPASLSSDFLGVPPGLQRPELARHRAPCTAEVSRIEAEASRVRHEDAVNVGLGAAGRRGETGAAARMLERYGSLSLGAAGAGAAGAGAAEAGAGPGTG